MLKKSFLLLAALSAACIAVVRSQSAWYGQCGGIGWSGPTTCATGSSCVYNNDYYSQCIPNSNSGSANEAAVYGQCGGQGWTGATTCASGSTCVYNNDWYSQCLPSSNGAATSSAAPSTASSTQSTTQQTSSAQTNAPTTTGSSNSNPAALYGQCGGQGWTGAKSCVSGSTCVYNNDWYSQCLPDNNAQTSSAASSTQSTQTQASSTASTTIATSPTVTSATQASSTGSGGSSGYSSNGNTFISSKFKVGIDYNYYTNNNVDLTQYDYVTIWMNTIDGSGSTNWNQWYQGQMLKLCTDNNKTPLFYAYVIAFEARADKNWGLQDCDMGSPNLCQKGSEYIRQNRQHLVNKYSENAGNISATYGRNKVVVFVMEPDFWQYFGDTTTQLNGALSGTYMSDLFNDFVSAIKAQLPNALISWDISAWIGQDGATGFKQWWSYFKDSKIDFIHTSGGQAHGELANIKPNELTWSFVSSYTGKKIIADCGYGVGGYGANNCGVWSNTDNENARISDGVVALSVATVGGTVQKPSVNCC